MVLIGYEKRQGSFTSKDTGEMIDYDNIIIHVTDEFEAGKGKGLQANTLKMKREEAKRIFGSEEPDDYIGKQIQLVYKLGGGSKPVISDIIIV